MVEIDAGNTFIKWRRALACGAFSYGKIQTVSLNQRINALAHCFNNSFSTDDVLITSVLADDQTEVLVARLRNYFVGRIYLARVVDGLAGIKVAYRDTGSLGVDRWLAMIGAWGALSASRGFCVIDAGSAITADFVLLGGRHVGGCIMPGRNMLNNALTKSTQRVRVGGALHQCADFGIETDQCVGTGIQHMLLGAVSRLINVAVGLDCSHVILTGGDGEMFLALRSGVLDVLLLPDLVFSGLSDAYRLGGLLEV
jgi:type III pantothenate kinase